MLLKTPKKKLRRTIIILSVLLVILIVGIVIIAATFGASENVPRNYNESLNAALIQFQRSVYKWDDIGTEFSPLIYQYGGVSMDYTLWDILTGRFSRFEAEDTPVKKMIGSILPTYVLRTSTFDLNNPTQLRVLKTQLHRVAVRIDRSFLSYSAEMFGYLTPIFIRNLHMLDGRVDVTNFWSSVNYFLQNIGSDSGDGKNTVGVIDLNDIEMNIVTNLPNAGETVSSSSCPNDLISKQTIYSTEFNLYANSLPCLGPRRMEQRLNARLISGQSSPNIDNPCFPKGYERQIKSMPVYLDGCVEGPQAEVSFTKIYPRGKLDSYSFTGTGDYDECIAVMEALFKESTFYSCTANFPKPVGNFLAFTDRFSPIEKLNLFDVEIDRTNYRQRLRSLCSSNADGKALRDNIACLYGIHIDQLLTIFGFDDDSFKSIRFKEKLVQFSQTERMGFSFFAEYEGEIPRAVNFPPGAFIPIIIIVLLLFITCIFALIMSTRSYFKNRDMSYI